jgi:hypothetical protein
MARSTIAKQKPKKNVGGRPRTGITPMVGVRMKPETRHRIEALAKRSGLRFSDAVRVLLEIGLEHAPDTLEK